MGFRYDFESTLNVLKLKSYFFFSSVRWKSFFWEIQFFRKAISHLYTTPKEMIKYTKEVFYYNTESKASFFILNTDYNANQSEIFSSRYSRSKLRTIVLPGLPSETRDCSEAEESGCAVILICQTKDKRDHCLRKQLSVCCSTHSYNASLNPSISVVPGAPQRGVECWRCW